MTIRSECCWRVSLHDPVAKLRHSSGLNRSDLLKLYWRNAELVEEPHPNTEHRRQIDVYLIQQARRQRLLRNARAADRDEPIVGGPLCLTDRARCAVGDEDERRPWP